MTVPGDGDCFYSSIMLNIIHDALNGEIEEDSATAIAIKTNLLPMIAELPRQHYEKLTLRDSILNLLKIAPLKSNTANNEAPLVIAAIKKCDLHRLLSQYCNPALRKLTTYAIDKNPQAQNAIKDVLKAEFNNFIGMCYPNESVLGSDRHRIEFQSGEFFEFASYVKQYCDGKLQLDKLSIEKAIEQLNSNKNTPFPIDARRIHMLNIYKMLLTWHDASRATYEAWWIQNRNGKIARRNYISYHSQPKIMASKPQQIALAGALHCNIDLINKNREQISPLTPRINNANTFHLENPPLHYNPVIQPTTVDKSIGKALQKQMNLQPNAILAETVPTFLDIKKSIEETKNLIRENPEKKPAKNTLESSIFKAAKNGYQSMFNQPSGVSQETEDLYYAIRLQNDEIQEFIRRSRRR